MITPNGGGGWAGLKGQIGAGPRDEGVSKSGRGRGALRKEMYVMGPVHARCVQANCLLLPECRV